MFCATRSDAIAILRKEIAQIERAKSMEPADNTEGQADYWMVQGLAALRRQREELSRWNPSSQVLSQECMRLAAKATKATRE